MAYKIKVQKGYNQRVVFIEDCNPLADLTLRIFRCLDKLEEKIFPKERLVIAGGQVYIDFTPEDTEDFDGFYSWLIHNDAQNIIENGKIIFE